MVTDKKNDTANAYDTELGVNETDAEYKFWFKVENLKLMSGSLMMWKYHPKVLVTSQTRQWV